MSTADSFERPGGDDDDVAGALRALFGRDVVYVVLWAVQLVAAALVTPIVTRLLDVDAYGLVVTANSVMQILFLVFGLGLAQALQREYARNDDHRAAERLVAVGLVAATVGTMCGLLLAPWAAAALGIQAAPLQLAVVWAGLSAATNTGLALLRSQDRLVPFAFVSLFQSVVAEAISLLLVAFVADTATMFILGQAGAQVIALVGAIWLGGVSRLRRDDRGLVRRALRFGVPLVPAMLSVFVLDTSDRLLITALQGPGAVARYQVAYNVGALPMLLLGLLNTSWMPRIFTFTDHTRRAAVLAASRDVLYRLLVPTLVGMAAGAPLVLRLWAPSSYDPDDLLLVNAVVLLCAVPFAAGLSWTRALMAAGSTKFLALAQGGAAVVNVLLNLLLLPWLGLVGAALSTLVAFVVLTLVLGKGARWTTPVPRTPRSLLLTLCLACVATVALALVPTSSWWVPRALIVATTLLAFGYLLLRAPARATERRPAGGRA